MSEEERRPGRPRGRPLEYDDRKEMHVYLQPPIYRKVAESRLAGESWNYCINRLLGTPCPGIESHLPTDLRDKLAEEARQTGQTTLGIVKKILWERYVVEQSTTEKKIRHKKQDHFDSFLSRLSKLQPGLYGGEYILELLAETGLSANPDRLKRYLRHPRAKSLIEEHLSKSNGSQPKEKIYAVRQNLKCNHYRDGKCAVLLVIGKPADEATCYSVDVTNCKTKMDFEKEANERLNVPGQCPFRPACGKCYFTIEPCRAMPENCDIYRTNSKNREDEKG